jgi:hypothetical protein
MSKDNPFDLYEVEDTGAVTEKLNEIVDQFIEDGSVIDLKNSYRKLQKKYDDIGLSDTAVCEALIFEIEQRDTLKEYSADELENIYYAIYWH